MALTTFHFLDALKKRIEFFFCSEVCLEEDAMAGDEKLIVNTVNPFTIEAMGPDFNTLAIWDEDSTGRLIPGGRQGVETVRVKDIASSGKPTIYLEEPLANDWTVLDGSGASNNVLIARAPDCERIFNVYLGDVRVNVKFPAIVVIPKSKNIRWTWLSGSTDTITADISIYIKDDDTQDAHARSLKFTDALEWVLMSEFHISPTNQIYSFERATGSYVTDIQYGKIQIGSEFIQTSTLTYTMELSVWRSLVAAQGNLVTEFPFPAIKVNKT